MESLQTIRKIDLIDLQTRAIDLNQKGNQVRILSKDEIFNLIDVHEPYYALKDVTVSANHFAACRIESEQPLGKEVSPVAASEASRHMAILGSLCCAMVNPVKQKHYYLAYCGTYTRAVDEAYWTGNELIVTAECISFDKRKATVRACLLNHQYQLICGIDVSYHVIHHTVFERLYANGYQQMPDFELKNPYRIKSRLLDVQLSDLCATASLGEIRRENCLGHFPSFPAMPVAILLSALLDLATIYIHHAKGDETLNMLVKEFTLLADNLAFSGETVTLCVNQEACSDNRFKLRCLAKSTDGKSVGDITAIIESV
ncbi:hypothetical protein [Dyadobacter sp. OTU695]|uniref:hypothetical protein n=1 Tax=Dyadobacter sp. OTU695 TaxID=3043860 RepID=UPI00313C5129